MNYFETCQCCGQRKTAYTLPLNKSMVEAFIKFVDKTLYRGAGISKGKIGLTNAQYSNFQNLRHYGIVTQYDKGNEWYLTKLGEKFYYGETKLKSPIAFMAGETLSDDHPCWETESKERNPVHIRDVFPKFYKKRPEYQKEKNGQTELL